jgi:hypothetical protein
VSQDAFNEQVVEALRNITDCFERLETRIKGLETPDIQGYIGSIMLAKHVSGNVQGVINGLGGDECSYMKRYMHMHRDYFKGLLEDWNLPLDKDDEFWSRTVMPMLERRIEQAYSHSDTKSGVGGRHRL